MSPPGKLTVRSEAAHNRDVVMRFLVQGMLDEPPGKRSRNVPWPVARDTALNLFGALLPALITLVTVPPYLRVIGDARYGVLALVWLLIGYFGLFDLGLGRATTNRLARMRNASPESRSPVFWTAFLANLGLGTVGGLLLWGLTRAWGTELFGIPPELRPELIAATPFIAVAVPLVTVSSVLIGSLDALQDFARANAVGVLGASLTAVLPLAGALVIAPTLSVVVASAVVGRLTAGIAALWACWRANLFKGFRLGTLQELTSLLGYGSWVSVSSIISPVLVSLDRFVISSRLGAHFVPYYAVPSSLLSRVQVVAGSLQRALFPRLSADPEYPAKRAAMRSMLVLCAVMTPILVIMAPLLRPFIGMWIGPAFAQHAGPVGEVLVAGIWVNSLAFIPYGLLQAQGRPDLTAKFHGLELAPYLLVLWLGLKYYGLPGAAVAWSLRVAADAVLLLAASKVLHAALRELIRPALLVVASAVSSLTLPASVGPRILVACGLGTVSVWWSWSVLSMQFPGLLNAGVDVLRRHLVPRKQVG